MEFEETDALDEYSGYVDRNDCDICIPESVDQKDLYDLYQLELQKQFIGLFRLNR